MLVVYILKLFSLFMVLISLILACLVPNLWGKAYLYLKKKRNWEKIFLPVCFRKQNKKNREMAYGPKGIFFPCSKGIGAYVLEIIASLFGTFPRVFCHQKKKKNVVKR